MNPLLRAFIHLCLLRIGPQDLPSAAALRNLAIFSYITISIILSLITQQPFGTALLTAVTDSGLLILYVTIALRLTKHPARATQTLTALFGCGTLLSLLSVPPVLFYYASGQDPNSLVSLSVLALFIWNAMVMGHIFRYALNLPLLGGIVAAIFYMLLSVNLIGLLTHTPG